MKHKLAIVVAYLTFLASLPLLVWADPSSASGSGYAVTTNYHGIEIVPPPPPTDPLRANVSVSATNFGNVYNITVVLRDPSDNWVARVVHLRDPGNWADLDWVETTAHNGETVHWAWTGPLEPDEWVIGHYSVKAYFVADDGQGLANVEDLDAMRATTVMTVPEAPIGTLTILLVMLASLGIFARKKF